MIILYFHYHNCAHSIAVASCSSVTLSIVFVHCVQPTYIDWVYCLITALNMGRYPHTTKQHRTAGCPMIQLDSNTFHLEIPDSETIASDWDLNPGAGT